MQPSDLHVDVEATRRTAAPLQLILAVAPVDVPIVLASSGKGGVQFDVSYHGQKGIPPPDYYTVWYPEEATVPLTDVHATSLRHTAFGAVRAENKIGIRVIQASASGRAVAREQRGQRGQDSRVVV